MKMVAVLLTVLLSGCGSARLVPVYTPEQQQACLNRGGSFGLATDRDGNAQAWCIEPEGRP